LAAADSFFRNHKGLGFRTGPIRRGGEAMRLLKSRLVASSMLVSGLVLPAIALAAEPPAGSTVEEVVVTAQKTTENIQKVPIAITAVTAKALQEKGINDVAKLSNIAPNVSLDAGTPFSGSDTVLSAYIRGIGQDDFAFNLDPGVGVYVDGVYLARSVGANTTMLDVDRVEILKGPQGTLFGRNTIGGAISIITRDPGHDFMVRGEVTTGQFSRLDTKITADLPISDKLLTSITFDEERRNGWQHRIPFPGITSGSGIIPDCDASVPAGQICPVVNDTNTQFPASGYQTSQRPGGQNKWSGRGKVLFLPTDDFRVTFEGDYTYVDQPASPNTALRINGDQPGNVLPGAFGAATLSPLYNACVSLPQFVLGLAGLQTLCDNPRLNVSPVPTPVPPLPAIGAANADGNPNNNRLVYGPWFETNNPDFTYETGNSFSRLKNWGTSLTLDWRASPAAELKLISAYRQMHWKSGMDLDGGPASILEPSFDMTQHEWSEELQMTGRLFDDRLNYALGAYYFQEGGWLHDYVIFPGALLMIDGPNRLKTNAEALYAHADFKVTDLISIVAGGRYTWEHKTFQGYQTDDNGLAYKASGCYPPSAPSSIIGGPPGVDCQQLLGFPIPTSPYQYYPLGPFHQNFTKFDPTVGLELHPNQDLMIYGTFSEGFKTGSWTTRLSSPHPTYDSELFFGPENAYAEEVGVKSELFNHRLRLNLAGFHTIYNGIQLNSQIGISPTIVNAGNARIWGAEAEAEAVLGGGFSFTASLGWTDAKYTKLNNVGDNGFSLTLTSCPERLPSTGAGSRYNNPTIQNGACALPKTPEFKTYVGPQYVMDLQGHGQLQFNLDWTYTSTLYNDIGNTAELKRPPTNLINAQVTYKEPKGRWEITLGGTNLTNERYVVSGQNQGGVSVIDAVYSDPTEWFATFRFHY
jgi:iron complex outermembrane receptor protein